MLNIKWGISFFIDTDYQKGVRAVNIKLLPYLPNPSARAGYDTRILPNPSARTGYDTRSIFERSLTGLNLEYSFS